MLPSRAFLQFLKNVPHITTRRALSTTACAYGIRSRWHAPLRRKLYHREQMMIRDDKAPANIRSEYIEWNYDSEIFAFGKRLHEEFNDSLLRQALTDSSYIEKEKSRQLALGVDNPALQMSSNSKLSVAGKALIENYSAKFLRSAFPLLPEEGIRKIVEYLTSEDMMNSVGYGIGLKDLILTEEHPPSAATMANVFQAVVAVLNVSSGINRCQLFIRDFVMTHIVGKDVYDIWQIEDPVGVLSDILIRSGKGEPEPRLLFQSGRNTIQAVYEVAMYSDKQFIGSGFGETVEVAVEQAAWNALQKLFQTTASSMPVSFGKATENKTFHDKENLSLDEWTIDKARNIVTC